MDRGSSRTKQLLLPDMIPHCTNPNQGHLLLFHSSPKKGYFLAIIPAGPQRALFPRTHPCQFAKITWPHPQPTHFTLKMDTVNSFEMRLSLLWDVMQQMYIVGSTNICCVTPHKSKGLVYTVSEACSFPPEFWYVNDRLHSVKPRIPKPGQGSLIYKQIWNLLLQLKNQTTVLSVEKPILSCQKSKS
jgi:hypothetical protein